MDQNNSNIVYANGGVWIDGVFYSTYQIHELGMTSAKEFAESCKRRASVFVPIKEWHGPKANYDLSRVSKICAHCGATEHLEPMKGYASYVCIKGHGCNADYIPGWSMYLFGALHVDIPYTLIFGFIIYFTYSFLSPYLYSIPDEGTIILGVLFGFLSLIIPVIFTVNGIPLFFSMLILSCFSWSLLFN